MKYDNKLTMVAKTKGATYRRLREAKGFKLKEASAGDFSSSLLSDFERGKSDLESSKFLRALENINVSTLEFQNAYNRFAKEKDILLYSFKIANAYNSQNLARMRAILDEVKQEIKKNNQIPKYHLDKIEVEVAIGLLDPAYKIPENDAEFLRKRLLNIKGWGRNELNSVNHSNTILDTVTLDTVASSMIEDSPLNPAPTHHQEVLISTLLNIIDTFIKRRQYEFAETYLTYLEESEIPDTYTAQRLNIAYSRAHLAYFKSKKLSSIKTMKDCREVSSKSGCFDMANLLNKEIEELEESERESHVQ